MRLLVPKFGQLLDGTYHHLEGIELQTTINGYTAETHRCKLTPDGKLWLKVGYIHDGPTGAVNTINTFMAAAKHDAIEGLVKCGALPKMVLVDSDKEYRSDLKKWGVRLWRRCLHFKGLKIYRVWLAIKAKIN